MRASSAWISVCSDATASGSSTLSGSSSGSGRDTKPRSGASIASTSSAPPPHSTLDSRGPLGGPKGLTDRSRCPLSRSPITRLRWIRAQDRASLEAWTVFASDREWWRLRLELRLRIRLLLPHAPFRGSAHRLGAALFSSPASLCPSPHLTGAGQLHRRPCLPPWGAAAIVAERRAAVQPRPRSREYERHAYESDAH
jgi:hypothetical protein